LFKLCVLIELMIFITYLIYFLAVGETTGEFGVVRD